MRKIFNHKSICIFAFLTNPMAKTVPEFYNLLLDKFPYETTNSQDKLLGSLATFIFDESKNSVFLLKGYAGTGKTTIISTVVNNLWKIRKKAVLLAPTGRAAKVISGYAGREAFTIHKKIYHPRKDKNGSVKFALQVNKHTDTLFIVDEASMIADASNSLISGSENSLLDDLINYVYAGRNCKLIFIGDTAQLPPVHLEISPALNENILMYEFDKEVRLHELTEVTRQGIDSGILVNATSIRSILEDGGYEEFQFQQKFPDVIRLIDGYDIQDAIHSSYDENGVEDTAFIVRSNKRANQYNQQIRLKIRGQENEISVGDFVMVVKNNYFWLKDSTHVGFIANGDTCEVLEIYATKELYDYKFAKVKLRMIDYPMQKPFETMILLDTLTSEAASLSYEEQNQLFQKVAEDFAHLPKYRQVQEIKKNEYFNALQVKFSYAMTCHKSQGGQWKNVFIEKPYLPEGQSIDYLRWLYTAVTRAKEKLYLIGFSDDDFMDY